MDIQVGDVLKVSVRGDQSKSLLQGVGGDPVIGVWQGDSLPFQRGADPRVDERGGIVGIQAIEAGEVFLGFEQCAGASLRTELAVEEFAHDMAADHRRIVPNHERLDLTMTPPEQLRRACIKQHCHDWRPLRECGRDFPG